MIKSLKLQIALAFFIVFLAISSGFSYFQFLQIRQLLVESYEESLKIEGKSMMDSFQPDPYLIPGTLPDQSIQIWLQSFGEWSPFYQRDDFPESATDIFYSLENSLPNEEPLIIELDSISLFIQKSAVFQSDVVSRAIILAKSNTKLKYELRSIRLRLYRSNLLASLVALLIAIAISYLLLNPLRQIVDKAKSISAGTKMDRLPNAKSSQEVAMLSETFNDMIERIESSIVRQNKFFDSASHELKTPLANLLVEIDYQLELEKQEPSRKVLKSLKSEVLKLTRLVNDFLMMSQLKSDQLNLKMEMLRIDDLLYDTLENLKNSYDEKTLDIRLNLNSEEDIKPILSDSSKLESIVSNLISNAFKYSRSSDKIEVELSQSKTQIVLIIRNSIDEGALINHGNKLGLWLSKELASKLGLMLETSRKETSFIAQLTTPLNVHSLQH